MRNLLLSAALLLAGPALADRFQAAAPVTAATVYPWGASVTREARLDLPAGAHELVIPGLPEGLDPASLRITGEGASIGAVGFQQQRALPATPAPTAELRAAEAELARHQDALARHDAAVAGIRARAEAAGDLIRFLMNLAESDAAGRGDIAALATTVGDRLLAARQAQVADRAETADRDRKDLALELARAEAQLAALSAPQPAGGTLVIALQGQGAPARIRITSLTHQAFWVPVHDLSLQRQAGRLRLDSGLLVSQNTGEDWLDAHLTFSTARPMDQSAPATLVPEFLRLASPRQDLALAAPEAKLAAPASLADAGAPVAGAVQTLLIGETVMHDYPTPVTLRSGADALRLPLGSHDLAATVLAEAVPRRDDSAYLVAEAVNTTGQAILPGDASFHADGALVGRGALELTAAGARMKLGFGPLDGIRLARRTPDESEGARGLVSKSSERRETALLEIRNLTDQEWPLRVIDQVPVSRQDELRIDWSADPVPDKTDPEGQRGLLVWQSRLLPGETREIRLTTRLRWPEGKVLIDAN